MTHRGVPHPEVPAAPGGEPRRIGHKHPQPSFETPRKMRGSLRMTARMRGHEMGDSTRSYFLRGAAMSLSLIEPETLSLIIN
jgi:hypothetical protein